jgi:hypothetical protein
VRLVALVRQRPNLTLVPPAALRLSLEGSGGSGLGIKESRPRSLTPSPKKSGARPQTAAPSWWTARARAGEVAPGFTKAEILKPAAENPRAEGGVFEQVGGLLSDLLDQG